MKNLIIKLIYTVFRLLPIKRTNILFIGYYGSQYGCSPKYLSQYFSKNDKNIKITWAFTQPQKYNIENIIPKRYYSLRYFYELATSKVIITNYRLPEYFKKRNKQFYIQTWHSSLRLKMIENDAVNTLPESYVKMAKYDSSQIDLLLSGCKFSSEIFKRAFWYNGEIFECGTPRCDILFQQNKSIIKSIKDRIGIKSDDKILLYAPTFRKGNNLSAYDIDFKRVLNELNQQGNWKVLIRLHPHLQDYSSELVNNNDSVINVTKYDDIQELLLITDLLISDYSSLMFDFAITKKPCVLYTSDLEEYLKKDRDLYFNINDLPFPICRNNNELIETIKSFDIEKYIIALNKFNLKIGSFEDGNASKRVYDKLIQIINK